MDYYFTMVIFRETRHAHRVESDVLIGPRPPWERAAIPDAQPAGTPGIAGSKPKKEGLSVENRVKSIGDGYRL